MLALAFGIFDGFGTFAGLALGGALTGGPITVVSRYLGPAMLMGYGFLLISVSHETPSRERDVGPRWMIVGVPLAFSVDNLVSGVALGLVPFGTISGSMALAGLRFGGMAIRLFPLPPGLWTGALMLLIGVMLAAD
jgi:putative Mn2+ efflux pump MntP